MNYSVVIDGEKKVTLTSSMKIANEAKKMAAETDAVVYIEYEDESGDSGFFNPNGKHEDTPRQWRK